MCITSSVEKDETNSRNYLKITYLTGDPAVA